MTIQVDEIPIVRLNVNDLLPEELNILTELANDVQYSYKGNNTRKRYAMEEMCNAFIRMTGVQVDVKRFGYWVYSITGQVAKWASKLKQKRHARKYRMRIKEQAEPIHKSLSVVSQIKMLSDKMMILEKQQREIKQLLIG